MTTATKPPATDVPAPPRWLPGDAGQTWHDLAAVPAGPPATDALTAALPAPTRRWLAHAIAPDVPLARAARIEMAGRIRIGDTWRRFRASQLLAPGRGYVWAARTRVAGLPVSGFDRYVAGTGEMRWRLAGVVPVASASDDDVAASAAGRLAAELALLPTAFGTAQWRATDDPDAFIGLTMIDGRREEVRFQTSHTGRLREVQSSRWGNPLGRPFARYPFGVLCHDETTYAGITIPSRITAGWFIGTPRWDNGIFYRAKITDLVPLG